MFVDQVPKYCGPNAIVCPPKTGPYGANTRTFTTFSDDLLFLLWNVIFSLMKEWKLLTVRARTD